MNVALPHIQADLGFSPTGLSWVMNAYTLAFGGLLLLGGRAGDILGRRRLFVGGIALFTLASLVGGLATRPRWLLAARVLQGVGAAAAGPNTIALITTTFTEPRRADPRARAAVRHGQRRLRDRPDRRRSAHRGRRRGAGCCSSTCRSASPRWCSRPGTSGSRSATRAGSRLRRRHRDRAAWPRWCTASSAPPRTAGATRRALATLAFGAVLLAAFVAIQAPVPAAADAVAPVRRPQPRGGVHLLPARPRRDDVDVLLPDPVPADRARLRRRWRPGWRSCRWPPACSR